MCDEHVPPLLKRGERIIPLCPSGILCQMEAVPALEATIRAAGREATFHVYPGTGHWFVEPNRPDTYNAAADLVWERTLAFLKVRLA